MAPGPDRLLRTLAFLVAVSGCGTVQSVTLNEHGPSVYGGTRMDAEKVMAHTGGGVSLVRDDKSSAGFNFALAACDLADLPSSVVADTVMLPLTIPTDRERAARLKRAGGQPTAEAEGKAD
jgi:uncharacterized protein YceK